MVSIEDFIKKHEGKIVDWDGKCSVLYTDVCMRG